MSRFWYIACPICKQGRLFVEVRSDTDEVILSCEECTSGWNRPDEVARNGRSFLTIEIETRDATAEDIKRVGWAINRFREATDVG